MQECYTIYEKSHIRATDQGEVMLEGKKDFSRFIKRIDIHYEHIVMEILRLLFDMLVDLYLIHTHLSPIETHFCEVSGFNNAMSILEHCLEVLQNSGELQSLDAVT